MSVSPTATIEEKTHERDAEIGKNEPAPVVLGEPPDGGLDAWLTVLGSSLVALSTFGCVF
jgi:hypothetical protein